MARRGPRRPGQHFLQSPKSRTFPVREIARLTEEEAEEIFRKARWPDTDGAPVCPHCGSKEHWPLPRWKRFKCKARGCRKQFSVTSGTPFAHHKQSFINMLIGLRAFAQDAKGKTAISGSHDVGCDYKTNFVFEHKVREALELSLRGFQLQGTVEVDGQYFGGYIRPENVKINRADRRLGENATGKRKVVVTVRERGEHGRAVVNVFDKEGEGRAWAAERTARTAIMMADQGPHWTALHATHEVRQVNHDERYALSDGTNTNQAESLFSRLRKFELGTHHHIAEPYLLLYAADGAWRENHRRKDHKTRTLGMLSAVMRAPQSRTFTGYWQRRRGISPDEGDFFANFV